MADRNYKNGKDYLLFINTEADVNGPAPSVDSPEWRVIACLSSNALSVSVDSIDVSTKCSDGWAASLPNNKSWTMSADGVAVSDIEEQDEVSNDELLSLIGTKVWAAIFDPSAGLSGSYRMGVVWISALDETASNNEAYTFSVTLNGSGQLYFNTGTT